MRPRISITGSIRPSVRPSVHRSVTLSSKTREIDIFDQIDKKNHVVMSSCNHSIIKRTHRWPYRPCSYESRKGPTASTILISDDRISTHASAYAKSASSGGGVKI